MPKVLTFLIIAGLIAVSALFFLLTRTQKQDHEAPQTLGKPITMPMPAPSPEPAAPPGPPEAEKEIVQEAIEPAIDAGKDAMTEPEGESHKDTPPDADAENQSRPEPEPTGRLPEINEEKNKEGLVTGNMVLAEKEPQADSHSAAVEKANAETRAPRKLKDVEVRAFDEKIEILIRTDGPVKAFRKILLPDPERLVIDLLGDWKEPQSYKKIVENDLVSKIRFWKYPDKLRVVTDLKQKVLLSPIFSEAPDGLIITILAPAQAQNESPQIEQKDEGDAAASQE